MAIEKTKISELVSVFPTGDATFPIVQGGATVSCQLTGITTYLKDVVISSYAITPSTTTYEIGDRLTALQLDWAFNKTPDQISITLHDGSVVTPVNTTVTYTDNFDITTGTKSWKLSGTDFKSSDSSTKTIQWVYPFFTGMDLNNLTDGTDIYSSSLTKLIRTKSNKTVALNGTLKYIYFAYPASYGNLSTIKDPNNFDVTSNFTKYSGNVTSTGLDNNYSNISYNIYSTYPNLVNATGDYIFNF